MLVRLFGGATLSASPIALALRLRVAGPGLLGPGLLGRDRVLTPGLPGGLLDPSSACEAWDTEPRVRRGGGFSSSSSSSSSESSSDGPFCLGGRPTRRWCPLLLFFLLNSTAVLRLTPDGDCCVLEVEVLRTLGGEEGVSSRSFMPGERGDRGDRGSSKSTSISVNKVFIMNDMIASLIKHAFVFNSNTHTGSRLKCNEVYCIINV